jgi:hypothetical protein
MTRILKYDCAPLQGELVYRADEYSFDFKVKSESELVLRQGSKGTTSLIVGTLQIEVGIETSAALFVWGLHSHSSQWRRDRLVHISPQKGCIRVLFDQQPVSGVSQGLVEVGEWQTTYDETTGWICVSSGVHDTRSSYIEFANNTVAELAGEVLVSLWLHPVWYRQRFEEGSVSLFGD